MDVKHDHLAGRLTVARILAPDGEFAPFVVTLHGVPGRSLKLDAAPIRVALGPRLLREGYRPALKSAP